MIFFAGALCPLGLESLVDLTGGGGWEGMFKDGRVRERGGS